MTPLFTPATWLLTSGLTALTISAGVATSCLIPAHADVSLYDASAPQRVERARPNPSGIMLGEESAVRVFTETWHGDAQAPFAKVLGAFRLESFPYGSPGAYSSVFFLRQGSYAYHAAVEAPTPEQDVGPDLGKILHRPLGVGQSGLTVIVAADGPQPGLREYLDDVTVRLTPRAGGTAIEAKTHAGEARFGVAPGRYLVFVDGAEEPAREIDLRANEGECVVFRFP